MKTNQSIYKFVDFKDHAIKNLKNRELICKYFDAYNDPFESHYGMKAEWPNPYKQQEELRQLITRLAPENVEENTTSIDAMKAYINKNRHLNDNFMGSFNETLKRYRVCSFTRRWNHILMWAHYGDGCRGAALIFDQNQILESDSARVVGSVEPIDAQHMPLQWVKYITTPKILNSVKLYEAGKSKSKELKDRALKDIVDACMLSKYKAWRYEQETRMVTLYKENIEKSPILYKYNEKALTGLLLGNKVTSKQIVDIAKSVSPSVIIHLTRPTQPRYNLEIYHTCVASDIIAGKVRFEVINDE